MRLLVIQVNFKPVKSSMKILEVSASTLTQSRLMFKKFRSSRIGILKLGIKLGYAQ